MDEIDILHYHPEMASYHPWDPRAPAVATLLIRAIEADNPVVTVEHVGSSSVPNCSGKGVIDLMLIYPPGGLTTAREHLDRFGFQHQVSKDPFPEERPMRVGALCYDGTEFRIHIHVISVDSPEVREFRAFREALLADPELVKAYMKRKREILADGIVDPTDYAKTKGSFCQDVLAGDPAQTSGRG